MLGNIYGILTLTIGGGLMTKYVYDEVFRKEIKANSKEDNVEEAFIKFIKRCNWRKKSLKLQILCGKKCCSIPAVFGFELTENEDLDDILSSIKNNNFAEFMRKNIIDEKTLSKLDFNSVINREVNYTMYPRSNTMLMSFY